jgi:hypothetical protein
MGDGRGRRPPRSNGLGLPVASLAPLTEEMTVKAEQELGAYILDPRLSIVRKIFAEFFFSKKCRENFPFIRKEFTKNLYERISRSNSACTPVYSCTYLQKFL